MNKVFMISLVLLMGLGSASALAAAQASFSKGGDWVSIVIEGRDKDALNLYGKLQIEPFQTGAFAIKEFTSDPGDFGVVARNSLALKFSSVDLQIAQGPNAQIDLGHKTAIYHVTGAAADAIGKTFSANPEMDYQTVDQRVKIHVAPGEFQMKYSEAK